MEVKSMTERAKAHWVSDADEAKYIARKGVWQARLALAQNPLTHPEGLRRLQYALDRPGKIKAALLAHPNLPDDVRETLTK